MQWNLIRVRKEHDDTQEDVARLLGISKAAYQNKESGINQFKSDEMFELAEHYGCKIDDIFLHSKYTKSLLETDNKEIKARG